ncbi:MAG TPA: YkgJ family cysteine cluster protein [Blastocatellia bacterium]|nr:YkgJ family cysteine cluster protein [Blastocatellia bacterium]
MKKRLSAKRKSELCLQCGKCCMSMTFFGGEVDDDARDEIHWMELHGLKIDYVERTNRRGRPVQEYYFTIPQRCGSLQEIDGKFTCGVYETRPRMCRDYDGRMEGPFGVADCLWRYESAEPALNVPSLVQLSVRPRSEQVRGKNRLRGPA